MTLIEKITNGYIDKDSIIVKDDKYFVEKLEHN